VVPLSIPSPSDSVWHIGPVPIRAYAIAIIIGILLAWYILDRRYRAKGGPGEATVDIAMWAVVFGILGARIYHVITDNQLYFGPGRNPIKVLYIWEGGLGIWGAITLGGVGVYLACRRLGLRLAPVADALAPGLLVAQAVGRIGNYFNQELYGKPTDVPWALEVDSAHRVAGYAAEATFHPTFLYELLWCLAGVLVLLWLERRFDLVAGQLFAAYVMVYTAGRMWIETLRIDTAHHILGLRLNVWTAIIVFLGGLIALVLLRRRYREHPDANDIWRAGKDPSREDSDSDRAEDAHDGQDDVDGEDPAESEDPAEDEDPDVEDTSAEGEDDSAHSDTEESASSGADHSAHSPA